MCSYGWWDWRLPDTYRPHHAIQLCQRTTHCPVRRTTEAAESLSAINIVLNLSILGVFKYYNFFAENFAALFGNIGWQIDWVTLDILLPVGISFYTFQALSYSIDVYQKKLPVCKDIIAFFAYISFFPQLVAGR